MVEPEESAFCGAAAPAYACRMQAQVAAAFDMPAVRAAARHTLRDLRVLYAFGSRAYGNARSDSDLDLAVLAQGPVDPALLHRLRLALGAETSHDIDLADPDRTSKVPRLEVIRNGVVLGLCDAEQVLHFEARALGQYAELLETTAVLLPQLLSLALQRMVGFRNATAYQYQTLVLAAAGALSRVGLHGLLAFVRCVASLR